MPSRTDEPERTDAGSYTGACGPDASAIILDFFGF